GPGGVSASVFVTALLATWGAIHARGPFTTLSPADNVLSLQVFLILMAMPLMFLAAVMTERHRTAQALRESQERYRSVVETQTELICRFLPDTTLTFVNDAYCRHFATSREELIGMTFLKLIPPASHATVRQNLEALIAHPNERPIEHEVLLPGG